MIARIRSWWKHLGYSWGGISPNGKFTTYGLRPIRGGPFFWLVIDRSNEARLKQSADHIARCPECESDQFTRPDPKEGI